jgi:hypothetical protein
MIENVLAHRAKPNVVWRIASSQNNRLDHQTGIGGVRVKGFRRPVSGAPLIRP